VLEAPGDAPPPVQSEVPAPPVDLLALLRGRFAERPPESTP
jgi:hypothetical protein